MPNVKITSIPGPHFPVDNIGIGITTPLPADKTRFMPEEEYVKSFTDRSESVPPFLVFLPYEVRDGVPGYIIPEKPEEKFPMPRISIVNDERNPVIQLDVEGRVLAKCPQCEHEYHLDELREYIDKYVRALALADAAIKDALKCIETDGLLDLNHEKGEVK